MEEHNSIFVYQEREHEQKLNVTTLELELVKNMNVELYNMLTKVRQERDEARSLLQKLLNNRYPIESHQENSLGFLHSSMSNSNITQYGNGSFSHCSPSSSSSPEFPNTSMNHVNHHHDQSFNYPMVHTKRSVCDDDYRSRYIDNIAKNRVLPQRGKLLQAMYDAGPLLQTILDDGQLPTWTNTYSQDFNSHVPSQVDSVKRQKYQ